MDRATFDLVQIIAPIVEGQLRNFTHAHPSILRGVTWRKRMDATDVFVSGAAKRINSALLCPETVARLRSALDRAGEGGGDSLAAPCGNHFPAVTRAVEVVGCLGRHA